MRKFRLFFTSAVLFCSLAIGAGWASAQTPAAPSQKPPATAAPAATPAQKPAPNRPKLPAGFVAPIHAHTGDYYGVNLTGTWRHSFDGGDQKELPPGSYVFQPGMGFHGDACPGPEDCRDAAPSAAVFASPKSRTFTTPSGAILMLPGLRSR